MTFYLATLNKSNFICKGITCSDVEQHMVETDDEIYIAIEDHDESYIGRQYDLKNAQWKDTVEYDTFEWPEPETAQPTEQDGINAEILLQLSEIIMELKTPYKANI